MHTGFTGVESDGIYRVNTKRDKKYVIVSPISDHLPVLARLGLHIIKQVVKRNIQIRDLKPANVKIFSEELGAVNWESIFRENNPSLAFEKFNTTLLGIYDSACPLKSMKIRKKAARKPWIDDELLRMIDIRNALYTAHINEPNEFSSAQFKDQRNLVNSTRRKKMRNFYGEEFKKNASNPEATWIIINEVIRGSPAPQQYSLNAGGEIVRDLDKVCDLFAYHFSKIGETVQSEAAVNNELLIEESTFEDLRGQDFEMKLEPCDSVEIEKIMPYRPRLQRPTVREMLFILEEDKETCRSPLLYKAFVK
ncbi:hypothetical protein QYM36_019982 [Artemia franciscana]|uniref:Uncharacterized protein n=1 Tax=Artemia franciscana TaxID=6661 RepID=A0AA88KYW8_ARTSF|nr:hypothetical protein QYM36_019982 [Artemia franciscana]